MERLITLIAPCQIVTADGLRDFLVKFPYGKGLIEGMRPCIVDLMDQGPKESTVRKSFSSRRVVNSSPPVRFVDSRRSMRQDGRRHGSRDLPSERSVRFGFRLLRG
jgi:hypothetical protein